MNRRFVTALLLCIFSVASALAQAGITLRGTVSDASGAVIPDVAITITNTRTGVTATTLTRDNGRYEFPGLAGGAYTILAERQGLQSQTQEVVLNSGGTSTFTRVLDFQLGVSVASTEITVTPEIPMLSTSDDISRIQLAPEQIAVLPSLGERDIFRAFQLLPGVSGSNETSSGLFVRGGRPDQNFIDYDGFRVYHVDHLFGYFSAFNMDAIEKAELSKGGFEAKNGGTLSSVMNITGKTGRLERPSFSAGVSMLSYNALVSAPLLNNKASALFAIRRSFQGPLFNKISDLFDNSSGPGPGGPSGARGRFAATFDTQPSSNFYDTNGKFFIKPSGDDALALSLFKGTDNIDNSRTLQIPQELRDRIAARGVDLASSGFDTTNPSFSITDIRRSENTGGSLSWAHSWNDEMRSTISLGYSRFNDLQDRELQAGSNSNPRSENNYLQDYTFRANLPIRLSPGHTLEAGLELTSNDSAYVLRGMGMVPGGTAGATTAATLANVLDEAETSRLTSVYVQDRWLLGSKLLLVPGIRVTRFDRTNTQHNDPRFAASLFVNGSLKFKMAAGKYHQFTNRITREDLLQGNRAFWTIADGDMVPVSSATHLIAGASYQRANYLIDLEVFRKKLSNLTQFAPRLTAASQDVEYRDFFYQGSGQAEGAEILVQRRTDRNTGWVSYTYSRVNETFSQLESAPFPADHDQRHEIKIVDVMEFGKWTLSGTFVGATGKPYTEPAGFEPVTLPFGGTFDRIVIGSKNGARLPAYHRMDLAINRDFLLGTDGWKASFGVTLFNLYNRKNVWYKEFNVVEGEIAENNIRLMGRTLNLSFGVKF